MVADMLPKVDCGREKTPLNVVPKFQVRDTSGGRDQEFHCMAAAYLEKRT